MKFQRILPGIGLITLALASAARADVRLPSIFSDHLVLQQGAAVPVWGWASPGEQVKVSVGGQKQTATTGADGRWQLKLDKLQASATPTEMTIAGKNTLTIKDVLIGEVWLGSGQSNMEFTVSKKVKSFSGVNNEEQEIAAANHPQIRMFTVKMKLTEEPQDDCEGSWQVCSPETVPAFSAVGYFFSRDLQQAIKQPVGFINVSYGASTAQAWINPDVLAADPQYKPMLEAYAKAIETYDAAAATRAAGPATRASRGARNPHQDQHNPSQCYNAMLRPVQPYGIRGVVWYQGESITGSLEQFVALNNTLITSWRKEWDSPELPFYFVQLAALDNNSNRPEVREAQAQALKLPHTGMAVTIDIGDRRNVHPKDKQDVGDRLARIARANVYGEKIEFSGPMFESMQSAGGGAVRLTFSHAGSGLVAKGGDLKGFTISGHDDNFVPATAKIEGSMVVVSAPGVDAPKAVRYAWNRWPEGANLYNGDGLPAAPFRTDTPFK